jgi:tetratricopeptide (TPR) repeat protein
MLRSLNCGRISLYSELAPANVLYFKINMATSGKHLGWIKKAADLMEWKQYKQAIAAYEKAIKLKSNCVEAWLGKGQALLESGEYDAAIGAFERVIKLQPQDFEGYYYKAAALEEAERLDETEAFHREIVEVLPKTPGAWFFYGMFLNRQKRYEEALTLISRAIDFTPAAMYLLARSICLEKMERYQAALDDLDRLLLQDDSALAWTNHANLLVKLERYEAALDSYGQASRAEPRLMEPWEKRVALLLQLDRWDEAHKIALTLTKVFTDFEPAWTLLGQVMQWQGQYDEAIAHYSRAIEFDVDDDAAKAFYGLAVCYAQQGQGDLASGNLQRAIALDATYRDTAKTEPAVANLLESAEFQALLPVPDAPQSEFAATP